MNQPTGSLCRGGGWPMRRSKCVSGPGLLRAASARTPCLAWAPQASAGQHSRSSSCSEDSSTSCSCSPSTPAIERLEPAASSTGLQVPRNGSPVQKLGHAGLAAPWPTEASHQHLLAGAIGVGLCTVALLHPGTASASEGALTGSALDLFKAFLDQVENLGPLGVLLFVVTVMLAEMVPLFPTQPLSLASGLLFGGFQGTLIVLTGVTLAAINAFSISKGIGRPLAERVINYEMGEGGGEHGVARKLAEVQATIEGGSFWQQFTAVLLLRLTPVVPFSASNYVLGLTPVQFPAFVGGTIAGMSVWSLVYATLGGASREVLDSGKDLGTLFIELAEQSGSYTKIIALAAVVLLGLGMLYWLTTRDAAPEPTSQTQKTKELLVREEVKEKLLQRK